MKLADVANFSCKWEFFGQKQHFAISFEQFSYLTVYCENLARNLSLAGIPAKQRGGLLQPRNADLLCAEKVLSDFLGICHSFRNIVSAGLEV